jgi:hypothetical protein
MYLPCRNLSVVDCPGISIWDGANGSSSRGRASPSPVRRDGVVVVVVGAIRSEFADVEPENFSLHSDTPWSLMSDAKVPDAAATRRRRVARLARSASTTRIGWAERDHRSSTADEIMTANLLLLCETGRYCLSLVDPIDDDIANVVSLRTG